MVLFPLQQLRQQVTELAARGVYIGTSSWKYEGWLGQVYSPERYLRYFKAGPPKLLKGRFEMTCLKEYAETFKTVCLDAGFYQFPSAKWLDGYFSQVPPDFQFSLKVTEDITVLRFPSLPRYGKRAGQSNPHFLDAEVFATQFLAPLEPYRDRVGTLIFEFSPFHAGDLERGRDFVAALGSFFGLLPKGWRYSVEIRNESLLQPEYFAVLRSHNVAHTFNSWSRMPSVSEQVKMAGADTAGFATARFLLKPGRTYEQAVKVFQPYMEIKEPYPEGREAIVYLLRQATTHASRRYYLYVNNRFEGSALWTIVKALKAITDEADPAL